MAYNESTVEALEVLDTITHINHESSRTDRAQAISEIRGAIMALGCALKDLAGDEGNLYFESYLQAEFEGSESGWLGEFLVDQLRNLERRVDGEED